MGLPEESTHVGIGGKAVAISAWTVLGLRWRERWGGFDRCPFTANSRNVVHVYGK